MKRWEYMMITCIDIGVNVMALNNYGAIGWEMCGCHRTEHGDWVLIFKREIITT